MNRSDSDAIKAMDKVARDAPPQDLDAEQLLVGAMLGFPERFVDVMDLVQADQFYHPQHQAIWNAMLYLHEDAVPIDVVSVAARLEEMKPFKKTPNWKLHELQNEALTSVGAEKWAERIVKCWRLRIIIAESSHLLGRAMAPGADPESLVELIAGIEDKLEAQRPSVAKTAGDVAGQVLRNLAEVRKSGVKPGTSTGFVDVDKYIGGLRRGDLVIGAARPGMGKTAFAGNIALDVSRSLPVLFISIEMSEDDITERLLSSVSGVNSILIRDAKVNDDEMARLQGARVKLADSKLWIADMPNATIGQIAGLARRVKHKCGDLGLVVVDYLQLITHSARELPRHEQVADISRRLKCLARQLNCTVLALSQVSRKVEDRHDKRPLMSDLRESGAIEQDADVIAFLYRHEEYYPNDESAHGKAEVIIGKARKGCTGVVHMVFDSATTTFRSAAPSWHSGEGFPANGY